MSIQTECNAIEKSSLGNMPAQAMSLGNGLTPGMVRILETMRRKSVSVYYTKFHVLTPHAMPAKASRADFNALLEQGLVRVELGRLVANSQD